MTRYPKIRVSLRTAHPMALVAGVRHALRRAGVAHDEIDLFSNQVFAAAEPERIAEICREWVAIELARPPSSHENA